jgi:hypothetical protein
LEIFVSGLLLSNEGWDLTVIFCGCCKSDCMYRDTVEVKSQTVQKHFCV